MKKSLYFLFTYLLFAGCSGQQKVPSTQDTVENIDTIEPTENLIIDIIE